MRTEPFVDSTKLVAFDRWVKRTFDQIFTGPPRAYYENAAGRVIYDVVRFGMLEVDRPPEDPHDLLIDTMKHVFLLLKKAGATQIVWRRDPEIQYLSSWEHERCLWTMSVRLAALDSADKQVPILPEWISEDGSPSRELTREMIEELRATLPHPCDDNTCDSETTHKASCSNQNPLVVHPAGIGGVAESLRALKPLVEEFGQKNVEETLIYIMKAYDPKGLRVRIKPTPEMVRSILEAVHRRMGVNEVRISL